MDNKPRYKCYGLACSIEVTHTIETSVSTHRVGNGGPFFLLGGVTLKRHPAGHKSKSLLSGGNVRPPQHLLG